MRAFARLEKKEKRKEQLHQALSSPTETKTTSKDNNTVSSGSTTPAKVNTGCSDSFSRDINMIVKQIISTLCTRQLLNCNLLNVVSRPVCIDQMKSNCYQEHLIA